MIKLISLIFVLVAAYSASGLQTRKCPPINQERHHSKQSAHVANRRMESIVLNSTARSSNLTAAVLRNLSKWPKGKKPDGKYEIPYKFDENFTFEAKEAVYFGMVMIERGTNIIFTKKRKRNAHFILFARPDNDDVCDSHVGVEEQQGKQVIQLASWCTVPHYVIHELLHAIGLKHEHQRTDRSISNGTWDDGRSLAPDPAIKPLTPYDPFSLMHYALPKNATLRREDNWTSMDTLLARQFRVFPTLCDYSGVNQIYEGYVKPPPCTNVRTHPKLLRATEEGNRQWKELKMTKPIETLTRACNLVSGMTFKGVPLFSAERKNRTLCQFEANSMYPDFGWIPYAERITHPLSGLNYSEFKVFPAEVEPDWMTHDICDCLGPPPTYVSTLGDHSMYQMCLECVHSRNTTFKVLKCIAKRSKSYSPVLKYLLETYNQTQYYLINPDKS